MCGAAGEVTNKLNAIFKKFGPHVKNFNLAACVPEKQLYLWLQSMPNLEVISCSHMSIDNEGHLPLPELCLPKLKKVEFSECLVGSKMNLIRAFPPGVIHELWWSNCFQQSKATNFLRNQPNIKILTLGCDSLAKESDLNKLNLTELTICNDYDAPFKMFCRQLNLTSLTLKEVPLDSAMFKTICSMKQLEFLKFAFHLFNEIPASELARLEQLPKLKTLQISGGDSSQLEVLQVLNLQKLEYISLYDFSGIDRFWASIGNNFKNVKKVRFGPTFDLSTIGSIMRKIPNVESIKMAMGYAETRNFYEPNVSEINYGRLKKFYIADDSFDPKYFDVIPFLNACNSLEEIHLHTPMHIEFLEHILRTKPMLRKLSMSIDERSCRKGGCVISSKIIDAVEGRANFLEGLLLVFGAHSWNMKLDLEYIRKRLIERFPRIDQEHDRFIIKKRGVAEMEVWDS